jgi:hypothetical protein
MSVGEITELVKNNLVHHQEGEMLMAYVTEEKAWVFMMQFHSIKKQEFIWPLRKLQDRIGADRERISTLIDLDNLIVSARFKLTPMPVDQALADLKLIKPIMKTHTTPARIVELEKICKRIMHVPNCIRVAAQVQYYIDKYDLTTWLNCIEESFIEGLQHTLGVPTYAK